MGQFVNDPLFRAILPNGTAIPGAKLYIYATGTTTEIRLYTDEAMTTLAANPLVADANGVFANVFIAETKFKMVMADASGAVLETRDPVYSVGTTTAVAASSVTYDGGAAGLAADNTQAAIDEVVGLLDGKSPTTHGHVASDVSDFAEAVDDRVYGLLVAGTSIGINYDDAAGTLTLSADALPLTKVRFGFITFGAATNGTSASATFSSALSAEPTVMFFQAANGSPPPGGLTINSKSATGFTATISNYANAGTATVFYYMAILF